MGEKEVMQTSLVYQIGVKIFREKINGNLIKIEVFKFRLGWVVKMRFLRNEN